MINQNPTNPAQAEVLARLKLEKQMRSGASWFFWIAGLSIINTLIYILNGTITFVVGLGITQLIDGLAMGISDIAEPSMMPIIRSLGLVINLAIAGGFVGLGLLGRNGKLWAIITGMVLYALDIIILLIASDWLSLAFHLLALAGLFSGAAACSKLSKLDSQAIVVPPERIAGIY